MAEVFFLVNKLKVCPSLAMLKFQVKSHIEEYCIKQHRSRSNLIELANALNRVEEESDSSGSLLKILQIAILSAIDRSENFHNPHQPGPNKTPDTSQPTGENTVIQGKSSGKHGYIKEIFFLRRDTTTITTTKNNETYNGRQTATMRHRIRHLDPCRL